MKKKEQISVGEILQRIYDSEIHLRIGWFWDGGLDYIIGATCIELLNGGEPVKSTGESNVERAVCIMADDIATEYPDSDFAKWWNPDNYDCPIHGKQDGGE